MRVSDKGVAEIAAHEGIVPMPYRDSVGVWTFGIGHTRSAGAPNPATMPKGVEQPMSKVIEVFRRDLKRFEDRVSKAVKVPLKQHEFDALVSFDFNTGGVHRASLTKHLNAGNRQAAADAFMGWSKPAEIIPRRRAEQRLFRTGQYGNGMANVYPANAQGRIQWGSGKRVNVLSLMGASPAPAPKPSPKPESPGARTYTIRPGDTLSEIAARNGVSTFELATINGIGDPDRIEVGRVLRIPASQPPEKPSQPRQPSEPVPPRVESSPPSGARPWLIIAGLIVAALVVAWLVAG